MHNYYFKIRKKDTEFEFSTDNLEDFDKKVYDWVKTFCTPSSPKKEPENTSVAERMDFIDIRNLVKINDFTGEIKQEPQNEDFEAVLEKASESPKLNLDRELARQSELFKFITDKNIQTQLDFLIMTAFYMMHFEGITRFTIKQINSRLVPLNIAPITHGTIHQAVLDGYVEIVPDLTGLGDVMEYSLSQKGEDYYYGQE